MDNPLKQKFIPEGRVFEKGVSGKWVADDRFKVFIGSDPNDGMRENFARQFDAFVNVSCTSCNTFAEPYKKNLIKFWYPIDEMSYWGMKTFYWTNKTLDSLVKQDKTIYWHCHAGAHRSPLTFYIFLLYWGLSTRQANKAIWGVKPIDERFLLFNGILEGRISPFIFSFIKSQKKLQDTPELEDFSFGAVLSSAMIDDRWLDFLPKEMRSQRALFNSLYFKWDGISPYMNVRVEDKKKHRQWCDKVLKAFCTKSDYRYWTTLLKRYDE